MNGFTDRLWDAKVACERRAQDYIQKAEQLRERAAQSRAATSGAPTTAIKPDIPPYDANIARLESLALLNSRRAEAAAQGFLLASDHDRADPLPALGALNREARNLGLVRYDRPDREDVTELPGGSFSRIA